MSTTLLALGLVALGFVVPALADCDGCTITCIISPLPPGSTLFKLRQACSTKLTTSLRTIGNPRIRWGHGFEGGTVNRQQTAYTNSGDARLVGPTPRSPSFSLTLGDTQIKVACPNPC